MAQVSPEQSEDELGQVGVPHTLTFQPKGFRPQAEVNRARPSKVFAVSVEGSPLLVRSDWEDVVTVTYEVDGHGVLQPWQMEPAVSFMTCSCMAWGFTVLVVLSFFTMLCVLPYVIFPALGLVLLSFVPILVFATFVQLRFAQSVKLLQTVTSFFEAIAWFIPLVGVILIIYFPVGWRAWVADCEEVVQPDMECLGQRAIQAYLMTAFLEELLKFMCVRRLLWLPFVMDAWALCCYGGAAGLGFAAIENALYVGGGNLFTALLRAGTAVPNHLAYGLLHGAFLSRRRFLRGGSCANLSPILPMLLHGSHNFSIALCEFVNLPLGLVVMSLVALVALLSLRCAMRDLGAEVDVHELIESKLVEGPACCLCCQGQCGWAKSWPMGGVASAQPEHRFKVSGRLLLRGVGRGLYELSGVGDFSSAEVSKGKIYFETIIDSTSFRIGLHSSSGEDFALGPEGLWHNGELLEARPAEMRCRVGCLLDLEAKLLTFHGQHALPADSGAWCLQGSLSTGRLRLDLATAKHDAQPFQAASTVVGQVVGVLID